MSPEAASRQSALAVHAALLDRALTPEGFRSALAVVPPTERDAWLDLVLDTGELPPDGDELPRGCTPYLPCSVSTLIEHRF